VHGEDRIVRKPGEKTVCYHGCGAANLPMPRNASQPNSESLSATRSEVRRSSTRVQVRMEIWPLFSWFIVEFCHTLNICIVAARNFPAQSATYLPQAEQKL
jgi:hypothetical protein